MAAVMEERPGNRPRSKSAFSLKSDKSDLSSGSRKHTRALSSGKETAEEKHRSHLSVQGKANPNAAMNEAQPIAAALEAPTIGSLRSIQHVDQEGNPIAEPDLSNPTRPRWERPLDTIRSFEAAIDGEYKRRSVAQSRPTTAMFSDSGVGFQSRRTSYFGAMDQYSQQPRYSQANSQPGGGYYNRNRDSYAENGGPGYGFNQMSPAGRPRHDRRQHSEPMPNRYNNGGYNHGGGEGVYPTPGYQQSRDTVNTGESNGSHSEPWTNSTDPSSENSSIDRANGVHKPADPAEQYGYAGYGGTASAFNSQPIVEEMAPYGEPAQPPRGPENGPPNGGYRYQQLQGPPQSRGPPQPPPHSYSGNQQRPRNTLTKFGGGPPPVPNKDGVQVTARPAIQSTPSQKKKSWLKRTFSKKE